MDAIYILEHIYEIDEIEEIKFIGAFSSEENAKAAIEFLRFKPGFKDHPVSSFHIERCMLDQYEWKEGFISWDEANKTE